MRKHILKSLVCALCLLAMLSASALAEYALIGSSDGFANLRWGPGMSYAPISELYNGSIVYITGSDGNWRQVITPSGAIGYVYRDMLKATNDSFAVSLGGAGGIESSDGFANLRRGPGKNYSAADELVNGCVVRILGLDGNWSYVEWAGEYGYVHTSLIKRGAYDFLRGETALRTGPSEANSALVTLSSGEGVMILGRDANYSYVRTFYGAAGFVKNSRLEFAP